jgi:FixJ family two-component response regulator
VANAGLISIIDDDSSIRETTASLLELHGYTVAAFASGEEFLSSDLVKETSCLITDVRMSGINDRYKSHDFDL